MKRGVAEKSSCAVIGVFSCRLSDYRVPLAAFVVSVMCLIIDDQQLSVASRDAVGKIGLLQLLGWRLRAEDGGHYIRLLFLGAVRTLVKLLNVGEEQHAFGVGAFAFAPHDTIEVPEDAEFFGPDRIFAEDVAIGEIGFQPLKDDDVGRDYEESSWRSLWRFRPARGGH